MDLEGPAAISNSVMVVEGEGAITMRGSVDLSMVKFAVLGCMTF